MRSALSGVGCLLLLILASSAEAQEREFPEPLRPWIGWATWEDGHLKCPPVYQGGERICFWPSRFTLQADQQQADFQMDVTVFETAWVPLPGDARLWPRDVKAGEDVLPVVARKGVPHVELETGEHRLTGTFRWNEMPQRIAVPGQIGLLELKVLGEAVEIPTWDVDGHVWLKRLQAEAQDQDFLSAQTFRLIEDGIPVWLRTKIVLTVSGKSREEQLGAALPAGWILTTVESPLPVAIDELGQVKAQVRAGKWTVELSAYRAVNQEEIRFPEGVTPISSSELIGFRPNPSERIAEIQGLPSVDVTQTIYPEPWRDVAVFGWETNTTFQLVEKMRGMGLQRPGGLNIRRRLWLDDDGSAFTYLDTVDGEMQQIWRLDVAEGQDLGAVRADGEGQLITANPATGDHGVEVRDRNLKLEAVGRLSSRGVLPATGWQVNADQLNMTLTLPPGWRVLALFGADRVEGDWLTAWSLLDLFLLLIFSLAVYRMWGLPAGVLALVAFGLSYHEPGAPRLTWLFLLMPLALLRVVPEGTARKWLLSWRFLATCLLLINLLPFLFFQAQSAIYPQLEQRGTNYAPRSMFHWLGGTYRATTGFVDYVQEGDLPASGKLALLQTRQTNLLYEPSAKIQTGPAQPEWDWNNVYCSWDGPVSAEQRLRPILVNRTQRRFLTISRVFLLLLLGVILFRPRGTLVVARWLKLSGRSAGVLVMAVAGLAAVEASAQIPDHEVLEQLRRRILDSQEEVLGAAEIAEVKLSLDQNELQMQLVVHAARSVAVPLPGKLPAWSPVSVRLDDQAEIILCRKDGYLWAAVPAGVHVLDVRGRLPDTTEWDWTFQLKPRSVSIDAPGWTVTGVGPDGVPDSQVFFAQRQETGPGEAAYDQKNFRVLVQVRREVEIGLVWRVRTTVTRLSAEGKGVALTIPLLPEESVLESSMEVAANGVLVNLGARDDSVVWTSELPVRESLQLVAPDTEDWVEEWNVVTSPVWNTTLEGLSPVFEVGQGDLVPTWRPWPGETVDLQFNRPEAVSGETVTIQQIAHDVELGSRQRNAVLKLGVECSLATDLNIELGSPVEVTSLKIDDQSIPVRQDGATVIVPARPGKQTVELAWRATTPLSLTTTAGKVRLPVPGANVTTTVRVPNNRWVLWAQGPLRGPAVRFWTILFCALVAAWCLGGVELSPLRRYEWVLLTLGLTQINVVAAMVVVGWLFLVAWRGRKVPGDGGRWTFNLLQLLLVLLTGITLAIFVVIVGEGLLGDPEMFIIGNGSSPSYLRWFQPRTADVLPEPSVISVSVWFYRVLMLAWALWLASALLRWLQWTWSQFSAGGCWAKKVRQSG